MPKEYDFSYPIPRWSAKPVLVGAVTVISLKIVEVLYTKLQPAERSDRILLDSCQAALHGCHGEVTEYLWKRIPDRDRVWRRQVNLDIARYGTITLLTEAILNLKCHYEPSEEGILYRTDPRSDGSAYGHYFSACWSVRRNMGISKTLRYS